MEQHKVDQHLHYKGPRKKGEKGPENLFGKKKEWLKIFLPGEENNIHIQEARKLPIK